MRTLLQRIGQYLETRGFTVASHSNKRVGVLPCFLLVKISVTVVSQFTLFLSLAEHRHWKRLGPQLCRTVCAWRWGRNGTSGSRAALAMALELEQGKGMRELQAAPIYSGSWGWAGTGGRSQFSGSFPLLSCSSARQAAWPQVSLWTPC